MIIDSVFWWVGAMVCIMGGLGIVAVIVELAIDKLTTLFNVKRRILQWWWHEVRKAREAGNER